MVIAIPMTIYFIYFARQGIIFLSGNAYEGAVMPMKLIMPTLVLIGITNILGIQMLVPMGREKSVLYSEIAGAVVDVIINAILIPKYASVGAAIGTLVAEAVVLIVQFYALKEKVKDAFIQIPYLKIICAALIGSGAALWVKKFENGGSIGTLILSAILFFGTYGCTLLVLKEKNSCRNI